MRPLVALLCSCSLSALAAASPAAPAATIAARLAGLERHEGLLPWAWDARAGKLLVEIDRPADELLYGAGLSWGAGTIDASLDRGQLGDLKLVHFERVGPRVLLVQRQLDHRGTVADPERERAIEQSFPVSVLAALPLVAEDRGRLLVDATGLVLHDEVVLPQLQQAQPGAWKQDDARSALRLEGCGAFPRNTELEALLTFTADRPAPGIARVMPDPHALSVVVHHTFLALPPAGYVPRAADPRVGFFLTAFEDLSAPTAAPLVRRWIARWRLVKRDPAAAVSKPVQPIVYYLDSGLPEPERATVLRAALWWSRAFEAAGFRDALVLRDLPAGASFLDARYSGIQWTHRTERAWSIGQSQTDPRTGEILHAVVLLDSHRRRTTDRMWRNLEPPARGACDAGDAPDLARLAAAPAEVAESTLVLARLAYLTAHEVGHTLGLGHNMAATTFGWGSVMDYLAPHFEPRGDGLDASDAYPGDIGAYDRLAIRWGYGSDDSLARDRLVRDACAAGVAYPLESDARWNEYDWGPDPAAWLATCRRVRAVLLARFGPGQLRPGEPYYALEERFSLAYLYHRFALAAAQHAIGGEHVTNALAGDGQTPREALPAAAQRAALDQVLGCLAPAELDVPDRIAAALLPPPTDWPATRERFASDQGDAFSRLEAARALARLIVAPLLEPARASALADAVAPGSLGLAEVLRRLDAATWSAPEERDPRLAPLQRVAQLAALEAGMALAASGPASPEARSLALAELVRLAGALRARHSGDPATEAHLRMAERDLTAFLAAPAAWRGARAVEPPPGRPIGSRP